MQYAGAAEGAGAGDGAGAGEGAGAGTVQAPPLLHVSGDGTPAAHEKLLLFTYLFHLLHIY